ncbi:MAG: hypothetical protein WDW38_001159 [Sanguina aurantia]
MHSRGRVTSSSSSDLLKAYRSPVAAVCHQANTRTPSSTSITCRGQQPRITARHSHSLCYHQQSSRASSHRHSSMQVRMRILIIPIPTAMMMTTPKQRKNSKFRSSGMSNNNNIHNHNHNHNNSNNHNNNNRISSSSSSRHIAQHIDIAAIGPATSTSHTIFSLPSASHAHLPAPSLTHNRDEPGQNVSCHGGACSDVGGQGWAVCHSTTSFPVQATRAAQPSSRNTLSVASPGGSGLGSSECSSAISCNAGGVEALLLGPTASMAATLLEWQTTHGQGSAGGSTDLMDPTTDKVLRFDPAVGAHGAFYFVDLHQADQPSPTSNGGSSSCSELLLCDPHHPPADASHSRAQPAPMLITREAPPRSGRDRLPSPRPHTPHSHHPAPETHHDPLSRHTTRSQHAAASHSHHHHRYPDGLQSPPGPATAAAAAAAAAAAVQATPRAHMRLLDVGSSSSGSLSDLESELTDTSSLSSLLSYQAPHAGRSTPRSHHQPLHHPPLPHLSVHHHSSNPPPSATQHYRHQQQGHVVSDRHRQRRPSLTVSKAAGKHAVGLRESDADPTDGGTLSDQETWAERQQRQRLSLHYADFEDSLSDLLMHEDILSSKVPYSPQHHTRPPSPASHQRYRSQAAQLMQQGRERSVQGGLRNALFATKTMAGRTPLPRPTSATGGGTARDSYGDRATHRPSGTQTSPDPLTTQGSLHDWLSEVSVEENDVLLLKLLEHEQRGRRWEPHSWRVPNEL